MTAGCAVAKPKPGKDNLGRFVQGNRFWEARSSCGANPKFESPAELAKACQEYFDWNADNPLWADNLVVYQGNAKHEPVAKMRAMTVGALCLFLDIDHSTWIEWRKTRPDLSQVIARVEHTIRAQKFEGASADLLNANIIARDLGLADKSELTGANGAPIAVETVDIGNLELARRIAFLLTDTSETK